VHISELAQHHVENPREVVSQGQAVDVKIIEIDGERRRLSLSLKRVEPDDPVQPRADGGESVHLHPNLDLSDRAGADEDELPAGYEEEPEAEPEPAAEARGEALEAAEEDAGPAEESPATAELEADLAEGDAAPAVESDDE